MAFNLCGFNNRLDSFCTLCSVQWCAVVFEGVVIPHRLVSIAKYFLSVFLSLFFFYLCFLLLPLIYTRGENVVLEAKCYQMISVGDCASLLCTLQMLAGPVTCLVLLSLCPGYCVPGISLLGPEYTDQIQHSLHTVEMREVFESSLQARIPFQLRLSWE